MDGDDALKVTQKTQRLITAGLTKIWAEFRKASREAMGDIGRKEAAEETRDAVQALIDRIGEETHGEVIEDVLRMRRVRVTSQKRWLAEVGMWRDKGLSWAEAASEALVSAKSSSVMSRATSFEEWKKQADTQVRQARLKRRADRSSTEEESAENDDEETKSMSNDAFAFMMCRQRRLLQHIDRAKNASKKRSAKKYMMGAAKKKVCAVTVSADVAKALRKVKGRKRLHKRNRVARLDSSSSGESDDNEDHGRSKKNKRPPPVAMSESESEAEDNEEMMQDEAENGGEAEDADMGYETAKV